MALELQEKIGVENRGQTPIFLRRTMRLPDATALVIGCIIGAGIFRMAAPVATHVTYPGLVMLVWIAGGLLSFCGALCYAELGAAMPKTGGDYVYLTSAFGRLTGFLFGWTKLFIERTGTIAVLGFVFAEYLGYFTGSGPVGTKIAASSAIILLTLANTFGVQYGARVQNVFSTLKVLSLAGIIVVGWIMVGARPFDVAQGGRAVPLQTWWPASMEFSSFSSWGLALTFVLWTYGGWTESAYVAEEIQNPQKNIPRSILYGLLLTTALYLVVNWVYMLYVPLNEMPQHKLVAAEMMRRAVGPWGGGIISAMVVCSTFGALNGYILTSARLLFAIGQDHPVWTLLGKIHPKFATPARALSFNAAAAILLVWTGTLDQIVTYSTVVISIFYAMAGLAVIILRKRYPDLERPYKVWGYPWIPLIFAATMLIYVWDVWTKQPQEAWFGIGLLAAGVPLYLLSQRIKSASPQEIHK